MKKLKHMLRPALMLLLAALSLTAFITPRAPDSPLTSAAWDTVEFMSTEPRMIFSPEHLRRTENHIVQRLEDAGLPVMVTEHDLVPEDSILGADRLKLWVENLGFSPDVIESTSTRNIYSYIPGTSDKFVIFNAHYDSFPDSPGAADNATSVAALLESFIDFHQRGEKPEVGIQVLFSDGHEFGFGAGQFVKEHPDLLENTIFALNFDVVGNGPILPIGGANEFSNQFFKAVSNPTGFSILADAHPLDERFFAKADIPAMSLVNFTRPWHYHVPSDVIENLSPGTVTHSIDVMSRLMEQVSQTEWAEDFEAEAPTTHFMLAYHVFIQYGGVVRSLISLLAIVSLIGLILLKRQELQISLKGIFTSIAGVVLLLILYAGISVGAFMLFFRTVDHHPYLIISGLLLAVLLPLASYFYLKGLARFIQYETFAVSIAGVFLALGLAQAVLMPGTEYLSLLPVLLIAARLLLPQNKILYYVSGVLLGLLYLPLLFIMTFVLGMALPIPALYYVLFIILFYVLAKNYPKSTPS
ncbi:M28 family peptidase [Lactococcus garvieae]|nr:M28 family peptidase [Lactococcus garvieae]